MKILSTIRVLIYRLDMNNLQTKTVSFPDQEKKFLKEALFSLAVSMNANIENSQIKHCPCPIYIEIYIYIYLSIYLSICLYILYIYNIYIYI